MITCAAKLSLDINITSHMSILCSMGIIYYPVPEIRRSGYGKSQQDIAKEHTKGTKLGFERL